MQLTVKATEPDLTLVCCEGEITQYEFRTGYDPLEALLGADPYTKRVLLSLEGSQYIDSSGISWLIVSHQRFLKKGGKLVIYAVPPMVRDVLEQMLLPRILNIATTEADARSIAQG